MKDDKRTNPIDLTDQIEKVEGTAVSNLRRLCVSFFERMTSIRVDRPVMFKIAFLHKGTKTVKKLKGDIVDVVSKRHEWHEASVEGEPIQVLFLNERLGLSHLRTPLSNAEALRRYIGAIMHGLAEEFIERKVNARGVPINDTNFNNQLDRLGFRKWDLPTAHAEAFITLVASKVTLPVEAFEIADPAKQDGPRDRYIMEFRDEANKLVHSTVTTKSFFEGFRDKTDNLSISLIKVDKDAYDKANKAAKDAERDSREKQDTATKMARMAELTKRVESLKDLELLD